jgi:hypothetical protein
MNELGGKKLERSCHVQIEVSSRHFFRKTTKNISVNSTSFSRDLNRTPPEYKSRTLTIDQLLQPYIILSVYIVVVNKLLLRVPLVLMLE